MHAWCKVKPEYQFTSMSNVSIVLVHAEPYYNVRYGTHITQTFTFSFDVDNFRLFVEKPVINYVRIIASAQCNILTHLHLHLHLLQQSIMYLLHLLDCCTHGIVCILHLSMRHMYTLAYYCIVWVCVCTVLCQPVSVCICILCGWL